MRIALMVIRLLYAVPYYFLCIIWDGKHSSREKGYNRIKHIIKKANRAGRVKIETEGLENLPEENGFIMFPNHQGMYDPLVFLETFPRPFSVVYKKEVKNIILLKQVFRVLNAIPIDRKDLRQSMQVIKEMSERVSKGENFLIFAEGTRSKDGNHMLDMKGGSFKSAVKAKAPIVPCALVDCYKPFDEKGIKPLVVKIFYLKPMYYEEYKDMSTVEIAIEVKRRIEEVLSQFEGQNSSNISII